MSSGRGQRIPALGGTNPDYWAETASIAPESPAPRPHHSRPHAHHHQQPQQQQSYNQYQQPVYAPPPPNHTQQPPPSQFYPLPQQSSHHDDDVPPPKPPRPRLHQWSVKAGAPINKVANRLGSEAFWPSTIDLECDKAARILQSFCQDGFYTSTSPRTSGPSSSSSIKKPAKALVTIPQRAIQSAAGLAIFTTLRTGLHVSGAGGSGIIVARLPDSRWSPPSGFVVHTLGAGFMAGLDIYDCVCVLRTRDAVAAFSARPRLSLGGEIGLVAGPIGGGAAVETALNGGKNDKPVWSYMKSRGLYAGVQADGTVVVARQDANAAFYGKKGITVAEILRGDVPAQGPKGMWPSGARHLMEVLKAAEGRPDVDEGVVREVSGGPTLGDLGVQDPGEKDLRPPPPYERGRYC
ncbi:duf500 domain-containing protein [Podospora didyma]|uniref:Duf500 domain-containing protein n=1 Tax=Podospora didyma TaxID=330526 RepID=A0AAE0N524_9PEZI|nr:duf500 domain-containing protein [Podospora didyma]